MGSYSNSGEIKVEDLLLEQCVIGRFTPRKGFNPRYVNELAESIRNEGLWKPIIVRPHPTRDNTFELIDGEHRIRALQKLGRSYVRAEIRHLSDDEADLLAIRVNQMHGRRLTEWEEARHIAKLMEVYQWTQKQVADKLHRSQSWVSRRLLLITNTRPEVLEAIMTRVISPSVGREIAELPVNIQPEAISKVQSERLTFRETELLIHTIKEQPEQTTEILSKSILALTPPPKNIQKYEDKYGSDRPKFEKVECPYCGKPLAVNWVFGRISQVVEDDER